MKQTLKKVSHTLYTVLCTVVYRMKLWNINAAYCQLDMDMMCTTMTYKEYCEEKEMIDYRYDALTNNT